MTVILFPLYLHRYGFVSQDVLQPVSSSSVSSRITIILLQLIVLTVKGVTLWPGPLVEETYHYILTQTQQQLMMVGGEVPTGVYRSNSDSYESVMRLLEQNTKHYGSCSFHLTTVLVATMDLTPAYCVCIQDLLLDDHCGIMAGLIQSHPKWHTAQQKTKVGLPLT